MALTRWSAFLWIVSCQISGYTKCGSYGLSRSYASFVTALRPRLSGISVVLLRCFELESVDAYQLLPDVLFACDWHLCNWRIPTYLHVTCVRNGVLTNDIISIQEWFTVVHIVSMYEWLTVVHIVSMQEWLTVVRIVSMQEWLTVVHIVSMQEWLTVVRIVSMQEWLIGMHAHCDTYLAKSSMTRAC